MAKRFTDSEKWKKPFIRSMKAPYKLLWLYLLDECNHAGIWQVDFTVAQIKIGEKLNIDTALEFFKDKVIVFDNSEKWFLPDFLEFQYGELNPANRAHNSIISLLKKYNLIDESLKIKPLTRPLQGDKETSTKNKDMVKEEISREEISEIQTNFTEYPNEVLRCWPAFENFLSEKCVRVQKLPKPITINDFSEHFQLYQSETGKNVLLAMENRKDLLQKYTSAHLTFLNWISREHKTIKNPNPTDRFSVGNQKHGNRLGD